jgi:DNA-binding MarR family transcriptional regulator
MQDFKPLGPLMGHCFRLGRERMDARLEAYDVTPAQMHVLHYLYHHGNQADQCAVTAHLKVKASTAAGILERMEEKELIRRTVSEADARYKHITLTEKGAESQSRFKAVFEEVEGQMTKGLSLEETEQLYALLLKVRANLEEDRGL